MVQLVTVATCHLDQWAMDFDTNLRNIQNSIREAKKQGAKFRTGPELEVTGYGCEDHFLEVDTQTHSWESILELLDSDLTDDILCDIGLPVLHHGVRYNCRIFLLNRKVLLIRPKIYLADDGNYREGRWFTGWRRIKTIEQHTLPQAIQQLTKQTSVPFGIALLECEADGSTITSETCEELFTPDAPDIALGLSGAEIIANGSGSHFSSRKLTQRLELIRNVTSKNGGCYLYANQQGCDGGRLYYDGCACIHTNGTLLAQGSQFSVFDVEVVVATIDLEEIRSYRALTMSRSNQAATIEPFPIIKIGDGFRLTSERFGSNGTSYPTDPMEAHVHSAPEEIAYGPACWLWDYLRRSGATGFLLPLSGGADSAATLTIVGSMCQLLVKAAATGDEQVLKDIRRITGTQQDYTPTDAHELCQRIMHSVYMGTSNSSKETRQRAKHLAAEIGSFHLDFDIDGATTAVANIFSTLTNMKPMYKVHGGSHTENLALQNIQARMRMVFAYLCAALFPAVRQRQGWLLVLGSANVDEALRGYMTKYDCSSADINPIGGIAKGDLKEFLTWASTNLKYPALKEIINARPTAELEPVTDDYTQSDEADMGMSYSELGIYGKLRKVYRCGPVSMYNRLVHAWVNTRDLKPTEVAEKVKRFFFYYSINRHKMTTLTPSYHAETYSPDDNRFDLRQFLYNSTWSRQFRQIDALAAQDDKVIKKGKSDKHTVIADGKAELTWA